MVSISLSEDRRGSRSLAGMAVSLETEVIIIRIDLLWENRRMGTNAYRNRKVSWRQSYVNFRTLKRVPFDPT